MEKKNEDKRMMTGTGNMDTPDNKVTGTKTTRRRKTASDKVQKEPVRLREQLLSNGSRSLYLDIYRQGRRKREFLKLYLVVERTLVDKEQNRQTLATAQAIKAKRQIELQNGEYSFTNQFAQETLFLDYFEKQCEKAAAIPSKEGTAHNWYSALHHLKAYCDKHTRFKDIDAKWIEGFKDYLDKVERVNRPNVDSYGERIPNGLAQNTKAGYFIKLSTCLGIAYNEHVIPHNPMAGVEYYKHEEVERDFLTVEELRRLKATPCKKEWMRRAFLFSCLTGLRNCDIQRITWGKVQKVGDVYRIVFRQKKTGGQEYLDINPQAYELMGPRGADDERVFAKFSYSSHMLLSLKLWCADAGIHKPITFHCGRHTFAVMMLNNGADLYTVSKLLGHCDITSTQIYAKVLDKTKQEAVLSMPEI